jgi:hypothetical protein
VNKYFATVIVCAVCYFISVFVFRDYWFALNSAILVVLALLALLYSRVSELRIRVERVVRDVDELRRSIRELSESVANLYNNYMLLSSRVDYIHVTSPSPERVRGLEIDVKRLKAALKQLRRHYKYYLREAS